MSMHVEWDIARTCKIEILAAAEAEDVLHADYAVDGDYVAVLGGDGGGCLAIEGSRDQLTRLARALLATVDALPIETTAEEVTTELAPPARLAITAGPTATPGSHP